jgi:hypothetical protein
MIRTQTYGISLLLAMLFFCNSIVKCQDTVAKEPVILPNKLARNVETCSDTSVNFLLPIHSLIENAQIYETPFNLYRYWLITLNTYAARITNKENYNLSLSNKIRDTDYRKMNVIGGEKVTCVDDAAVAFLIEKCKNERIVMLNEDHISSNHRILAGILLDSLVKYGFNYFGAEGIGLLHNRLFTIYKTGYYTHDPMFANLVRKAIKNNFSVFGYDVDASGKDREIQQAENIFNNTFAKDTNAKVFIYAGFGHIHEKEGETKNMMAIEFFLLSGINPLTINQSELFDTVNVISIIDTVNLQKHRMITDICLANSITYDWYAEKSGYVPYQIEIPQHIANQAVADSLMYIVSIFRSEEYQQDKTAIPVYNYLLDNAATQITVKLPPNDDYLYVIKNRFGEAVVELKIKK